METEIFHMPNCDPVTRKPFATWIVSGIGQFMGSNLLDTILDVGQKVAGPDTFSTGFERNLREVETIVEDSASARYALP